MTEKRKRVLVIGSNGAGKTTFAKSLAEKYDLPLIHIDKLYWQGKWQVRPREEFEKLVLTEAQKEEWIIEGNNIKSLSQRLEYADMVFWFEFSPIICIKNILKREWQNRGRARDDMPEECISQLNLAFLRSAWGFNKRNRARIEELLQRRNDIAIIRFHTRRQIKRYLDERIPTDSILRTGLHCVCPVFRGGA